jgi:hypothetical protein
MRTHERLLRYLTSSLAIAGPTKRDRNETRLLRQEEPFELGTPIGRHHHIMYTPESGPGLVQANIAATNVTVGDDPTR